MDLRGAAMRAGARVVVSSPDFRLGALTTGIPVTGVTWINWIKSL
ncbi:hypothetical protein [Streptomyces sp. SID12501]|nr:hypothetical protein [Streptomyces sp. SID12501]